MFSIKKKLSVKTKIISSDCFQMTFFFILAHNLFSDEFYFEPYKNYKPVGLNVLFEARQLSVTDCMVKCNATTEVGIPCEMFVWDSLNSTCYFMNYEEIVLNISHGYYHEQRITNYEFVEGLTTYKRYSNTRKFIIHLLNIWNS